jgi:hypothetical protein
MASACAGTTQEVISMEKLTRIGVASVALALVLFSIATESALAKPARLCIPEKAGARVVSDSSQGTCKAGYKFAELGKEGEPASPDEEGICTPLAVSKPVLTPNSQDECPPHYTFVATGGELSGTEGKEGKEGKQGEEGPEGKEGKQGQEGKEGPEGKSGLSANELALLKSILPDIKFASSGVGGKPTIQFSGVNLQILNGTGNTFTSNGAGNLVLGYDEDPRKQTGSHNLVFGSAYQEFTSYAGILGGGENSITAPFDAILTGQSSSVTGPLAGVFGGESNTASEQGAVVVGGNANLASGSDSTVVGGYINNASGNSSSVGDGERNIASGGTASVSGGEYNTAAGEDSSVLGGSHIDLTGVAAVSP